ncbi:hypothetical protein LTR10_021624 [Elasticomyces elasticus]|uniref:Tautomerase cis-CaaD-like domain-containing protein n=1 Tax=Exophiala sideris TaxID=1016849 RepID=A0ABR0J2A3_9EURO|nr:hypothetical protein LTR10_021624 [Elasticomyces elasticus]KAK5024132.1 hypothetical protein LTS07_008867 [Exophiala sideris]KAK5029008.1 hypothetical protein LTR13_008878 [Exophiala sideris]KAK5054844.1 hypothetical protein LTR69_008752 [Exophiala sideris]KAK5178831.1 hypothetical protein LTR44_008659 [Eurotiomycetes sp. CCFEE 6388]
MPLYDVEHVTPLNADQQQSLALVMTDLHSKRFNTPKGFLNVRYTDVSGQIVFRGGKRAKYNRIILRTRSGEQRNKEMYDEHCRDIIAVWEDIVGKGGEMGLRTVWVMAALTTAVECGIARPRVGDEGKWLQDNMDSFRRLAAQGDEDFVDLVQELDSTKIDPGV